MNLNIQKFNKINCAELVKSLSKKYMDLPCTKLNKIVRQILQNIAEALIDSKKVELRNFGVFSLRFHPTRLAKNPKTGLPVKMSPRYTVHFKPGKELNARLNTKF